VDILNFTLRVAMKDKIGEKGDLAEDDPQANDYLHKLTGEFSAFVNMYLP